LNYRLGLEKLEFFFGICVVLDAQLKLSSSRWRSSRLTYTWLIASPPQETLLSSQRILDDQIQLSMKQQKTNDETKPKTKENFDLNRGKSTENLFTKKIYSAF
jgi:hypothetical protein